MSRSYDEALCSGPPEHDEWHVTMTVRVAVSAPDCAQALLLAHEEVESAIERGALAVSLIGMEVTETSEVK